MDEIPEVDFRYSAIEVGQELDIATFLLEPEQVVQYRRLFGNNALVHAGDPVPSFILAMLAHRFLTGQPKRPSGSIQVRQVSEFYGQARVGDRYLVRGSVAAKEERHGKHLGTFQLEGTLENGVVVYRGQATSILPAD